MQSSVNIVWNIVNPLVIVVNPAIPVPMATIAYSHQFTAQGGQSPYTFAVTAGALPSGLTLTAAGLLSGTVPSPQSATFTVTVTDAS